MALDNSIVQQTNWTIKTVPIANIASNDPLAWFRASSDADKWFWENPQNNISWVGLGTANSYEIKKENRFEESSKIAKSILDKLVIEAPHNAPLPRIVAGFSFEDTVQQGRWETFNRGRIVLPLVQILRIQNRVWLSCTNKTTPLFPNSPAPEPVQPANVNPADWSLPTSRQHYRSLIKKALTSIEKGELTKAVPCRNLNIPQKPDIPLLLATLRNIYPGCTTFCVSQGEATFVGATPECLVALSQGKLSTTALAGSAPRSEDPTIDTAIGQSLLNSPKEKTEHNVVVKAIRGELEKLGLIVQHCSEPKLMRLHGIQHLYTPLNAELPPSIGILDVVGSLHPTPAVAGYPRSKAKELRSEHEGFDRGWFAGPVGWLDDEGNGEFRVALRSALIDNYGTTLYAGAGVVRGSDPERELLETDMKLAAMLGPIMATSI